MLLGVANSVYHPADYAILSAHMDEARMGRAFSIHTFAGFLGGAVAPAIMAGARDLGRRVRRADRGRRDRRAGRAAAPGRGDSRCRRAGTRRRRAAPLRRRQSILTPALIVLTAFFTLLGLSNAGIANFGVVALMSGYGTSFSTANLALTAFLGASAAGVLAGGFLADRTERHGQVAAVCFAINTAIVLVIAFVTLPAIPLIAAMTIAGFLGGVIAPSRDMLVRNAAPPGAAGRAFGIVSTGFNFSGIASPLLFGWIMDQNMPHCGVHRLGRVHGADGGADIFHRAENPAEARDRRRTRGGCIAEPQRQLLTACRCGR